MVFTIDILDAIGWIISLICVAVLIILILVNYFKA